MSRIADEHLKALAGAQQPINAPWAAGTPTRRDLEFQETMDWDREKHASQLAAATGAASPYGSGAEGFAAMRGGQVDPWIADLDPARQEVYALVKDVVASGENFDSIYNTLDVARKRGKLTDKEMKEMVEFAELVFKEETANKLPSKNIMHTPGENVGQFMSRVGQAGQDYSGAKAQSSSLDAFKAQMQKDNFGDGFLNESKVTIPENVPATASSGSINPGGIQALVRKILGK